MYGVFNLLDYLFDYLLDIFFAICQFVMSGWAEDQRRAMHESAHKI